MNKKIDEAIELYSGFHEENARYIDTYEISIPNVGLLIGDIVAITYRAKVNGKLVLYEHKFRKNSQPKLVTDHNGTQLYIVGGKYEFTDRGIEDRG